MLVKKITALCKVHFMCGIKYFQCFGKLKMITVCGLFIALSSSTSLKYALDCCGKCIKTFRLGLDMEMCMVQIIQHL
jgi:hypothetical protein